MKYSIKQDDNYMSLKCLGERIQITKPKFFLADKQLTLAVLMCIGDWMYDNNVKEIEN